MHCCFKIMYLESLSILNYKNIGDAELRFSPGINCLLGNNGMGKSNLLDAVYYLSFCKSCSNLPDSQNVRRGEQLFMLKGVYDGVGSEGRTEVHCGFKLHQKKVFKRDDKEYERLSDHIGCIPLVIVWPEDFEIVRDGSDVRRRFIDQTLSQFDRRYLSALIAYNKALASRNALLRRGGAAVPELFELLEEQMGAAADFIFARRSEFVEGFAPVFERFYADICAGDELVSLSYRSHLAEGDLPAQLAESRMRDMDMGFSTRGVHKDDLVMEIGGFPLKKFGSQGQTKSFVIALRLAQFEFLKRASGKTPLLLLDDIFDKLDASRVERIMGLVSGDGFGQIFLTDTNRKYLDGILRSAPGEYRLFGVDNGVVSDMV